MLLYSVYIINIKRYIYLKHLNSFYIQKEIFLQLKWFSSMRCKICGSFYYVAIIIWNAE